MVRVLILAVALSTFGCSTVASRRKERGAAYLALPVELQRVVDNGRIRAGMNTDAVYIAWGNPNDITTDFDESGTTTYWLYNSYVLDTHWVRSYKTEQLRDGSTVESPDWDIKLSPRNYVRFRLTFKEGTLTGWHEYPRPPEQTFYEEAAQ